MMKRRLTDRDPRREQLRQARLLNALERRFRKAIASEVTRASLLMVGEYRNTGREPILPESHAQNLTRIYQGLVEISVEVFGERVITQGKSLGLILEQKSFKEFFQRLALQYIGLEAVRRRITSVSEATRSQIIAQIVAGQNAGESVSEIAKRIATAIPSISRQRGALIARTETHGAANFGADGAARETGLDLRKEWVAAHDERTRSSHAEADGQIVHMDQPFTVGGEKLMYPGDPAGSGSNVINCRCSVSHIVD